ncbi:MAG TPA: VCBS repeat-containing protein, partial [Candidatus Angelobacter sp.]|nr:VCBS repeat-containing protein [Candidatus Angelobacter sp.]
MTRKGWSALACVRARNLHFSALFVLLFTALASSRLNAATPAMNAGAARVKSAARAARATAMAMLPQAAQPGPKIWLGERKPLTANYVGVPQSVSAQTGVARPGQNFGPVPQAPEQVLASGQATPLAMVSGDFDHDGFSDLAVGYAAPGGGGIVAIHRGNMDAFAPQSQESWLAIGRGDFPSPFLPDVKVFAVPVSPDFLAVGKFTSANGFDDLLVAARGGSVLYVFPGNGDGTFGAPQTLSLTGGVTALTAGDLGHARAFGSLIIGLSAGSTSALQVMRGSKDGLVSVTVLRLKAPVSSIVFGEFGDPGQDVAFLAGGQISILRPSLQIVPVSLPVSASAIATGRFLFDRNAGDQIAVLASDGSVHIAARSEFDPRIYTNDEFSAIRQATLNQQEVPLAPKPSFAGNGWKIVESLPAVGQVTSGQTPVFFRARVLNNGADDVMWLSNSGQMAVISHPDSQPGEGFAPAQVSIRPYSGTPIHAITQRVNVDHRPGIITIHQGEVGPSALMPLPDPTFFVNRIDDPTPTSPIANACNNTSAADLSSSCSLREAILKANGDTVMLQAGTYTLTIAKVSGDCTGNFGALSVDRSLTLVGAGQNSTIIQAGTTAYNAGTPNGVDMVMNVNEDLGAGACPVTNASASISNLTIQNGHNRGTHGNDGDGGCMEFDTGSSGTATLALTNVTLQNCDTTQGNGGGLASFNFVVNGPGMPTITSSIIQGNKGVDSVGGGSTGGGIWVSVPSRMLMSSSQVMNNTVPTGVGLGGGISVLSNVSGSRQTIIHSSTISGNSANGSGGGIYATANLMVDQGTIISGNTGGVGNIVNSTDGGGLFLNTKNPDSVTLSKVTITGNHAPNGNGGGISDGNLSAGFGTLTLQFSRLAGNTSALGSNLNNINGTVTATDNWWGTNTPASTINNTTTTATFDPFIVLTHTASPNKIRINQSTTLTADMSKDNHGSGAALSGNLDTIVGVPIAFNNPVDGTVSGAQSTIQSTGMATATFNAGNVAGGGKADAVVDQQTVTANIVVLQPPSITKGFSPTVIKVGATSTITFSITNPN